MSFYQNEEDLIKIEEEVEEELEEEEEELEEEEEELEEDSEQKQNLVKKMEKNAAKTAVEILGKIIETNQVQYYNRNYSVDWLVNRLGSGKFSMPKYQRRYVWDENQVIALVVSLLKKLPIPKLYGYYIEETDAEQTTLVIDGQQRLMSLFMYYWGIFPTNKNRIDYSEKLKEINILCEEYYNKNTLKLRKEEIKTILRRDYKLKIEFDFVYKSNEVDEIQHKLDLSYRSKNSILTEQQKFRLLDSELEFLIVTGKHREEANAVDLFRIYNSSGTPLTPQEIRNGVFQKNYLYKLINDYSDSILTNINYKNHSWYKFNNINTLGDKKEIKKLFQLLAYFKFIEDLGEEGIVFKNYLEKDYNTNIEIYEKLFRKKGALENMIDNYSEYIADNGNNKLLLESEFNTIKSFFELNFENKTSNQRFNFTNIMMIYLILRMHNKLKEDITIPNKAIYVENKSKLNAYGFYERMKEITQILKDEKVI